MKRIVLLLSFVTLAFTSCSKSEDAPDVVTPIVDLNVILIKKVIQTPTGRPQITSTYTYNGNKISKMDVSMGSYSNFTYTGNLITKVETYQTTNNSLMGSELYTYVGDKLSSYVFNDFQNNTGIKHLCVVNTDGTVSVNSYSGNTVSQTTFTGSKKIFYSNGSISKVEYYQTSNGSLYQTVNYSYDTKNSPMKNVLGNDKLIFVEGKISRDCASNILSENYFSNTSNTTIIANTFTYNLDTNNYPTSRIDKDNTGTQYSSSQYFY